MQAQQTGLKANCIYLIQNRKTKRYLSSNLTSIHPDNGRITLKQLWVLIKKDVSEYQIVQMMSGDPLVWTEDQQSPLKTFKRRISFTVNNIWSIELAEIVHSTVYYWIKPNNRQNRCLHSSSMNQNVKLSNIDPTFQICLWHFKQFNMKTQNFNGLTLIQSPTRKYSMGLSSNTTKQDSQINLQETTTCGNQLWIIQPYNNVKQQKQCSFIIRNFYSRLLITLVKSNFGWKILQRCFNNLQNQRWILETTHQSFFYIKSAADQSMYLGFNNEKKGEKLIVDYVARRKEWVIQNNYSSKILDGVTKMVKKKSSIQYNEE